jgi:uncharacterized protein (DUF983 family)
MRAGVSFLEASRAVALGAFPGRCPNCRTHSMFRGYYTLYERCPSCGIRYERESGAWLGAVAVGYAVGALCAVALGLVELIWHPLRGLGVHPLATILIVSLIVTALAYRPSKGAWFALLWLYEFTDEPEPTSETEADPR